MSLETAKEVLHSLVETMEEVWQYLFKIANDYHKIKVGYFPLPIETDHAITETWAGAKAWALRLWRC